MVLDIVEGKHKPKDFGKFKVSDLKPIEKDYYDWLYRYSMDNGIDPERFTLILIQLAKDYALEYSIVAEIDAAGISQHLENENGSRFIEHPALKHLHATKGRILQMLKLMGLTPTSSSVQPFSVDKKSPFARL